MLTLGRYIKSNGRSGRKKITYPFLSISDEVRLRHLHIEGNTGVGKSTLIANCVGQDIRAGRGIALFDVHGDLAEDVLLRIPRERWSDVIYFAPHDRERPIGFNILQTAPEAERALIASLFIDSFKHLFDSWGPQLEQILLNAVLATLSIPGGSLLTLKYFLTHDTYRRSQLRHVEDAVVRNFWEHDFDEQMPAKERKERVLSTLNKVGQFIQDPLLRNIVGQSESRFSFQDIFDKNRIFIADLSDIGQRRASLIGSLLIAQLHSTALLRKQRHPFFVYVDEFQNFGSTSFIQMLSEIRKFGVGLTLAHQYMGQLTNEMQAAILGTVGTHVSFTVGPDDAKTLAPFFRAKEDELTDLPPFRALVRLPTQGRTMELMMEPLLFRALPSALRRIAAHTHRAYARRREDVEARIDRFLAAL